MKETTLTMKLDDYSALREKQAVVDSLNDTYNEVNDNVTKLKF